MTLSGTINKTFIMLALLLVAALFTWRTFFMAGGGEAGAESVAPFLVLGSIGGFIVALILIFTKTTAPYLAPVYAVLEGLALGGLSAIYEVDFPGIVIHAVALTIAVAMGMLLLYKTGIIKVTENFKLAVVSATFAIALVYVVDLILMFFGTKVPFIHDTGWLGIGISLFIVGIAALNLVLDFDFIEEGVNQGAPRYMEWYGAFGLVVTLVWLYLEILRLLSKLRSK